MLEGLYLRSRESDTGDDAAAMLETLLTSEAFLKQFWDPYANKPDIFDPNGFLFELERCKHKYNFTRFGDVHGELHSLMQSRR